MATSIRQFITDVWAKTGARTDPGAGKIDGGFVEEIPPYQWQNWWQNRVDESLRSNEQLGIWAWDAATNYEIDAITRGSDGVLYRAVVANTNTDPTTNFDTVWRPAIYKSASISGAGYIQLSTRVPLIVQWGNGVTIGASSFTDVTLPKVYSTAHWVAIGDAGDLSTTINAKVHAVALSLSVIRLYETTNSGSANASWLSIGV